MSSYSARWRTRSKEKRTRKTAKTSIMENLKLRHEFSKKLKSLREQTGLTQTNFAKSAGINPKNYEVYENGRSFPPYENLKRIADLLGYKTTDDLVYGNRKPKLKADINAALGRAPVHIQVAVKHLLSQY
jgi:DNA-binding XRE family transcriptional regulator